LNIERETLFTTLLHHPMRSSFIT